MPKLRHFDNTSTARFVTFNCYRDEPSLENDRAKSILVRYIEEAREKYRFRLFAYVFMPGHVHMVIHPPDGMPLGRMIGEIKSLTAREWFSATASPEKTAKHVFWQKRCYDHNCRTPAIVREKIEYCHADPVRQGLVPEPGDWIWSSYNWYLGKRDVPLQMDVNEL